MPRRSHADLNIVRLPGRGRPQPPAKLTQAEHRAWRAIVDSAPGGFIDGAGQLILRRVVAEIAVAERHEQRLKAIAVSGGEGALEAELAITRAHIALNRSITAGLTALRATPRSRMEARTARNAFERAPSGRRPWDIEAEASEIEAGEVEDGDETA